MNNLISNSIVAGHDVTGATNAQGSQVQNNNEILAKARKQSFWISLITGVVTSFIASCIFEWLKA